MKEEEEMQNNMICQDLHSAVCVCVCVSIIHTSPYPPGGLMGFLHVRRSKQTFLGLVFLGFALVIEAHCALVDTICLHAVTPPKPSGVVYTAKQGGARVKGQGEEAITKQPNSKKTHNIYQMSAVIFITNLCYAILKSCSPQKQ